MFIEQYKKGDNNWIYYLMTILMVPIGYIIFQMPLTGYLFYAVDKYDDVTAAQISEFESNPDFSLLHLDKSIGLILMIMMFVGVWLALFIGLRFLHKRPFLTLITPLKSINWSKILFSFGLFVGLSLFYDVISYGMYPEAYSLNFDLSNFIPLLIIGIIILPIQTTAEELFFRGYLLQGVVSWLKEPWIAVLITSILFGLIHGQNPEIQEYGVAPMMIYYIGAGIFLALITVFDNSLELAIGIHAAINFYAAVISSYSGAVLQTDTILKSNEMNPWLADFVMIIAFIIFMYICSKKYNWPPIGELIKKLDKNILEKIENKTI
jgi:membrane protease YdiL (CAAX protease family)